MPASEYLGWQAYFEIYPFSEDRADGRAAMLAAVIANVSGKTLKNSLRESIFMPDYLKERNKPMPITEKSLEQQAREWAEFKAKYQAAQKEAARYG